MAIADKLTQLNNVKLAIKRALIDKKVNMTGVAFTDYATKIDEIKTHTENLAYEFDNMSLTSSFTVPRIDKFYLDNDCTVEFVLALTSFNNVYWWKVYVGSYNEFGVSIRSGYFQFYWYNSSSSDGGFNATHSMSTGNTYHIAFVKEGTTIKVYIDKELVFTKTDVSIPQKNASNTFNNVNVGTLKKLRVVNRALTVDEFLDK